MSAIGIVCKSARWLAVITYRSENGFVDVDHHIEEIEDLHDIVERGPNWYAIEKIELRLLPSAVAPMTLEQAARE